MATDDDDTRRSVTLVIEPYCVLCRRNLPESKNCSRAGTPLENEGVAEWETECVGFFDASGPATQPEGVSKPCLHIFHTPLREKAWPLLSGEKDEDGDVRPPMSLRPKDETGENTPAVGIHFSGRRAYTHDKDNGSESRESRERSLYFVHSDCWRATRQLREGQDLDSEKLWNFGRLFRLAEQLRSLIPRQKEDGEKEYKAALSGILPSGSPFLEAAASTDSQAEPQAQNETETLTSLIQRATSLLPLEIQRQIAVYLDDGHAPSILRAIETASRVQHLVKPHKTENATVTSVSLDEAEHTVFLEKQEQRRLNRRQNGTDSGSPWPYQIVLRPHDQITGLRIYLGPLGVMGFSVKYANGGGSEMLGGRVIPPDSRCALQQKWFSAGQPTVSAVRDEIKVVGLFAANGDLAPLRSLVPEIPPYIDPTDLTGTAYPVPAEFAELVNPKWPERTLALVQKRSGLRHHPGRRVCHFLPFNMLVNGKPEWASGLTVYCTPVGGITGATVHFAGDGLTHSEVHKHVGGFTGSAIHLELVPGEFIDFVGMLVQREPEKSPIAPFLMAATNLGKVVVFGSLQPALVGTHSIPLVDMAMVGNPVLGLFFDRLTVGDGGHWRSIGTRNIPRPSYLADLESDDDYSPPALRIDLPFPPIPEHMVCRNMYRYYSFFSCVILETASLHSLPGYGVGGDIDDAGDAGDAGDGTEHGHGIGDSASASASVHGIARLQVCRRGDRVLGLAIHHSGRNSDGGHPMVSILGSWTPTVCGGDPARPDTYVQELDVGPTLFPTIKFVYCTNGEFIHDIVVVPQDDLGEEQSAEPTPPIQYADTLGPCTPLVPSDVVIDTRVHKSIAWWFHEYGNRVEIWDRAFAGVMWPGRDGVPPALQPKELIGLDCAVEPEILFASPAAAGTPGEE